MNLEKYEKSPFHSKMEALVKKANALRVDKDGPIDVTFADMLTEEFGVSVDEFYEQAGIDPSFDTIQNIFTTPDEDVRWLIPELFRDALRLGYRAAPIWPILTVVEESVKGLSQVLPSINMSDADPKRVGEGETIPVGTISYQSKKFEIFKVGRGIKVTDEVFNFVSLNVVSLYLQDFGIKMGHYLDALAINCAINGEQADGSEAAPAIGVATPGAVVFRDILKIWLRMSKIGRNPTTMLGGETAALDTLELDEFSTKHAGSTNYKLNLKTPLPQGADFYVHPLIPDNQLMIVDPAAALIKMNAVPLMVESERIVSNQTEAFYATFTTGFAKMFTDSCILMDKTLDFEDAGFPTGMDYAHNYVF